MPEPSLEFAGPKAKKRRERWWRGIFHSLGAHLKTCFINSSKLIRFNESLKINFKNEHTIKYAPQAVKDLALPLAVSRLSSAVSFLVPFSVCRNARIALACLSVHPLVWAGAGRGGRRGREQAALGGIYQNDSSKYRALWKLLVLNRNPFA